MIHRENGTGLGGERGGGELERLKCNVCGGAAHSLGHHCLPVYLVGNGQEGLEEAG